MEKRSKYLLKNTTVFAVGTLGAKLINFFLVPFYTHVLTQEEYGTADLIFTISMFAVPLVMFNLGEAIMRFAMDKDADDKKIFTIAVIAIAFGFIVSSAFIPISSSVPILSEYSIYLYLYIVFSASREVLTGFLRGKEQLKLYISCSLLNTFLIAVFNIYFLAILKKGIPGYLTSYILAEIIATFFAFFCGKMYRYFGKFKFDGLLAKKMIMFSLAVIPNTLLWWVINSSDRIMVTSMCSLAENGILAVSYKIPSILTMISTVLMQAWKYSAIKEKDSEDCTEYSNNMLNAYASGMILISAVLLALIRPISRILFSEAYFSSWQASSFLMVGFVFMGVSTFVGTIYYVEKNMLGNMLSAFVGAVINIILNFLFIPQMGAAGATLAASFSYLAILLYRYFDTRRYQKLHLFKKEYVISVALLMTMVMGNFMYGHIQWIIILIAFSAIIIINRSYIVSICKKFI